MRILVKLAVLCMTSSIGAAWIALPSNETSRTSSSLQRRAIGSRFATVIAHGVRTLKVGYGIAEPKLLEAKAMLTCRKLAPWDERAFESYSIKFEVPNESGPSPSRLVVFFGQGQFCDQQDEPVEWELPLNVPMTRKYAKYEAFTFDQQKVENFSPTKAMETIREDGRRFGLNSMERHIDSQQLRLVLPLKPLQGLPGNDPVFIIDGSGAVSLTGDILPWSKLDFDKDTG